MNNNLVYLSKFNHYNLFGLREELIINYLKLNNIFFPSNYLGSIQHFSFINYLKDIKIINNDKMLTIIFEILNKLFKNYFKFIIYIWTIIWSNLINKSKVYNTWINFYNEIYDKSKIIQKLVKKNAKKNRYLINEYYILIGTLEKKLIGKNLKQGKVIKERKKRIVLKEENLDIPSEVVLYNLYRFARETNIYNFLIKEIENNSFSPQKIFCISIEKIESLIKSIWNTCLYQILYIQNSLKIKLGRNIHLWIYFKICWRKI